MSIALGRKTVHQREVALIVDKVSQLAYNIQARSYANYRYFKAVSPVVGRHGFYTHTYTHTGYTAGYHMICPVRIANCKYNIKALIYLDPVMKEGKFGVLRHF